MKIIIIQADITLIHVAAIVNSANRSLFGGGGVDGAIHNAAGPGLLDECISIRKTSLINGLSTGQAIITKAYDLPSRFIIHTLGPKQGKDDIALLKDCYRNCLRLAESNGCESIAFPSISTGTFGVDILDAVKLVKQVLDKYESEIIKEIILVLHSEYDYSVYQDAFKDNIYKSA